MDSLEKSNFIVSTFEDIWDKEAKNLTLIDPYIYEDLSKKNFLKKYDLVEVLEAQTNDRGTVDAQLNFLDSKHELFRQEVISILKNIHGNSLTTKAWEKLISLSLLRHIKFCHDMFSICEKYFDLSKHFANILDVESFYIPEDFNSHRQYYQHSNLGSEQLFSVYCQVFYPDRLKPYKLVNKHNFQKNNLAEFKRNKSYTKKIQSKIKSLFEFERYRKYFLWILRKFNAITVLVFDCSFSKSEIVRLETQSFGKIASVDLPVLSGSKTADINARSVFNQYPDYFDRFDKFVFATLKHALPLSLIENFDEMKAQALTFFDLYPRVKWAVSEWWIGNSTTSFFLAIASQRNMNHLYPEHNYIAHPFLGNNLRHIYPLTDLFISIGWENQKQSQHIPGGSMYPWLEIESRKCRFNVSKYEILFISSVPVVRAPELNCSYGETGTSMVLSYLNMNSIFFKGLTKDVLHSIAYLPYPKSFSDNALVWDQENRLNEFIREFKYYIDDDTPARGLMTVVKLTVINYLSTSYLEALMLNTPLIVLWNKDSMLLDVEYLNYFDGLIEAGIFQENPIDAANFINRIACDPAIWWESEKVQMARKRFLNKTLKGPQSLRKIILGLTSR